MDISAEQFVQGQPQPQSIGHQQCETHSTDRITTHSAHSPCQMFALHLTDFLFAVDMELARN